MWVFLVFWKQHTLYNISIYLQTNGETKMYMNKFKSLCMYLSKKKTVCKVYMCVCVWTIHICPVFISPADFLNINVAFSCYLSRNKNALRFIWKYAFTKVIFLFFSIVGFAEKSVLQLLADLFRMLYRQMLPSILVIVEGLY